VSDGVYLYTDHMNDTIQTTIEEYQPSPETIELLRQTPVFFLVGIAGAGKDTVKSRLLQDPGYRHIISHTTRPPRDNNGVAERDGIDYHFVSVDEAVRMAKAKEFIEVKIVHGTIYGTSAREIAEARESGTIATTDIDVQGVAEYKRVAPESSIAVFLLPPSYDTWLERLSARYGEGGIPADELAKRTLSAVFELEHALSVPYYHFIMNEELDQTVATAHTIAHHHDTFNEIDEAVRHRAEQLLADIKSHL